MRKDLLLFGAGGHAKVIIDIIKENNEFNITNVVDKNTNQNKLLSIPIINENDILDNINKNFYTFIAIGDNLIRKKLFLNMNQKCANIINVIHKSAIISKEAQYSFGNVFMPRSVVNSNTVIGKNCIINTGVIIEHDVIIGDHVHLSPGAIIAGGVEIGDCTHIGIGANIIPGIKIGQNAIIGAGAVVIDDIPDNCTAVGVPAKIIKNNTK